MHCLLKSLCKKRLLWKNFIFSEGNFFEKKLNWKFNTKKLQKLKWRKKNKKILFFFGFKFQNLKLRTIQNCPFFKNTKFTQNYVQWIRRQNLRFRDLLLHTFPRKILWGFRFQKLKFRKTSFGKPLISKTS